jgi:hypothetical protein
MKPKPAATGPRRLGTETDASAQTHAKRTQFTDIELEPVSRETLPICRDYAADIEISTDS